MRADAVAWATLGVAALIAGSALAMYASSTGARQAGLAELGVFYGVAIAAAGALIVGLRAAMLIRRLARRR
ncbi:hypothetical protein [uncultured Jatrophihabitans sp.]|uniref:hypothetical protein n=1 Tax=uncultured Jatrophihabitans sp. TaxID=1610747 RepID=UPI0035C9B94A